MKEPHSEGVAHHTDPESCGGAGNSMAEALTGEEKRSRPCGVRRCARFHCKSPAVPFGPVPKVDPCPVADLVIADWNGKELARRKDAISPSLGAIVVSRDRRMILWAGISDRSTCSRELQIVELAASKPGAAKAPVKAGME